MDTPIPTPPVPTSNSMFTGASPKLTFWFGLIAGVAVTSILSLFIVVNRGASATDTKTDTAAANTNTAAAPAPTNPTGPIKEVASDDYVRGSGKLTLVEYSDLECPYCKTFHPTMEQVMKDYNGKVRWIYRHFPLSFHQNAPKEAEASLCVGKLGGDDKYWSFVDKIFQRTTSNGTGFALTDLGPLAKEVGVNQAKFQSCLDGGEMAKRVTAEQTDGSGGGVSGTPTTFLVGPDGKVISSLPGAYDLASVKAQIDAALSKI